MNTKTKLIISLALTLLGLLYSTGFMILLNNSVNNNNYDFGMALFTVSRFAPQLIFVLLGGLLLGSVWGVSTAVTILLISFVFTGLGIFSPLSIWLFPTSTFVQHIVTAACAGFFIKRASSYATIMLVVFCALVLGYFSYILVSYITHRDMLTIPNMLSTWIYIHGFGILMHALLVPAIYLVLRRFLLTDNSPL